MVAPLTLEKSDGFPLRTRENQAEAAAPQSLRVRCRNRPMRQRVPDKCQVFSSSTSPDGEQISRRGRVRGHAKTGKRMQLRLRVQSPLMR